jgi:hypothetical protein
VRLLLNLSLDFLLIEYYITHDITTAQPVASMQR